MLRPPPPAKKNSQLSDRQWLQVNTDSLNPVGVHHHHKVENRSHPLHIVSCPLVMIIRTSWAWRCGQIQPAGLLDYSYSNSEKPTSLQPPVLISISTSLLCFHLSSQTSKTFAAADNSYVAIWTGDTKGTVQSVFWQVMNNILMRLIKEIQLKAEILFMADSEKTFEEVCHLLKCPTVLQKSQSAGRTRHPSLSTERLVLHRLCITYIICSSG